MNGFQVARSVASWLWGQDQKRALKYVNDMEQAFNIRKKFVYRIFWVEGEDKMFWGTLFETREKAVAFAEERNQILNDDGTTTIREFKVEEWEVF